MYVNKIFILLIISITLISCKTYVKVIDENGTPIENAIVFAEEYRMFVPLLYKNANFYITGKDGIVKLKEYGSFHVMAVKKDYWSSEILSDSKIYKDKNGYIIIKLEQATFCNFKDTAMLGAFYMSDSELKTQFEEFCSWQVDTYKRMKKD